MRMNKLLGWGLALLIGSAAAFLFAANVYPDQVLSAYLWGSRWVAAAGSIEKLPAPRPIPSELPSTELKFVLLPAAAARWITQRGTWQPAPTDIDSLERNLSLVSRLKAENWPADSRITIDHPERYFRQYIAVIQKGKKLIYVSAFCDQIPVASWRQEFIQINDGGSCCWQAYYDPAKREFSALRINGVA